MTLKLTTIRAKLDELVKIEGQICVLLKDEEYQVAHRAASRLYNNVLTVQVGAGRLQHFMHRGVVIINNGE